MCCSSASSVKTSYKISRMAAAVRGFGTYRLKTKSRPCLVGAIHVALSELGAKRGGSVAEVGVGVRVRSLPRIVRASNSTSSAVLLPHLSLTQGVALKPKAFIRVSRGTA